MAVEAGRTPTPARLQRRSARRPRGRRRSTTLDRLTFTILRVVMGVFGRLPLELAVRVGATAALVGYAFARPLRRTGMRNLEIAFPERSLADRSRILRESVANLGRMIAELAHLPRMTAEDLRRHVVFEDEAWWAERISAPRETGGLILSGHFGNWEMLVFAHGMRGFPVSMVHRTIANPFIDRWLNQMRAHAGTRLVRKRQAAGGVLRALHDHELLVLPFDQNSTRGLGVFVDFFGVAASTNSGIARLSRRTGAPVVPAFIVREGRTARHRVHVLPMMYVQRTGDAELDVRRATQEFSDVFESMVRQYPEQWLWLHKRWKTRPPGEPKLY
jgi:KDO2-lipid IV(A) lauroyltransferase